MRSNLEHLIHDGAITALTGPVERNDSTTVKKHLACFYSPEDKELYRAASLKLVQIAKSKHPDRCYQNLEELLKQEN